MKVDDLIAIDVHTHAEVSCRQEPDEAWQPFEAASAKYFKAGKRPTIAETIAYYRERKIGLVMFTVDSANTRSARSASRTKKWPTPRARTATSCSRSRASIRTRARWACAKRAD